MGSLNPQNHLYGWLISGPRLGFMALGAASGLGDGEDIVRATSLYPSGGIYRAPHPTDAVCRARRCGSGSRLLHRHPRVAGSGCQRVFGPARQPGLRACPTDQRRSRRQRQVGALDRCLPGFQGPGRRNPVSRRRLGDDRRTGPRLCRVRNDVSRLAAVQCRVVHAVEQDHGVDAPDRLGLRQRR